MSLKPFAKAVAAATLGVALMGLGGCGYDEGVQFNGKIFDMVGLNAAPAKSGDPKMAIRQPLTLPPGTESLPPPGSGKEAQPSLAEIQDPDVKQRVTQADLEKQQAEYCKKNYDDALARGDTSADSAAGPLGSCHPSVFSALKKWTTGGSDDSSDDSQTQ